MNNTQIEELIHLLRDYELSIAALYETFASIFPLSNETWTNYGKEERLHAKWIMKLHSLIDNEKVSFEQTNINSTATRTAINHINNQRKFVVQNKIDLVDALNIAINIEKSLLESSFLKIFKLTAPNATKIQAQLIEATQDHLQRLIDWKSIIIKQ